MTCKCGNELNHNARRGMCSPCYRKQRYWERINENPDARVARNSYLRKRRIEGKDRPSENAQKNRMAGQRARRQANPEKTRAEKFARRTTGQVDLDYARLLLSDPCSYCGGAGGTIDHIVPIAKGGTNDWWNLTAACKSCNSGKCALELLEYLLRRVA